MRCAAAPATLHLAGRSSRRAGSPVQDRDGVSPPVGEAVTCTLQPWRSGHVEHVAAVLERPAESVRRVARGLQRGLVEGRDGLRGIAMDGEDGRCRPARRFLGRCRAGDGGKDPGALSQIRPQSVSVWAPWPAPAEATVLATATSVAAGADGAAVGDPGAVVPPPGPQPATRAAAISKNAARRRRAGIRPSYPGRRLGPPDMNGPRSLGRRGPARNGLAELSAVTAAGSEDLAAGEDLAARRSRRRRRRRRVLKTFPPSVTHPDPCRMRLAVVLVRVGRGHPSCTSSDS